MPSKKTKEKKTRSLRDHRRSRSRTPKRHKVRRSRSRRVRRSESELTGVVKSSSGTFYRHCSGIVQAQQRSRSSLYMDNELSMLEFHSRAKPAREAAPAAVRTKPTETVRTKPTETVRTKPTETAPPILSPAVVVPPLRPLSPARPNAFGAYNWRAMRTYGVGRRQYGYYNYGRRYQRPYYGMMYPGRLGPYGRMLRRRPYNYRRNFGRRRYGRMYKNSWRSFVWRNTEDRQVHLDRQLERYMGLQAVKAQLDRQIDAYMGNEWTGMEKTQRPDTYFTDDAAAPA